MNAFFALVRKDLKGYFDQPTGYVLLIIFVGIVSFLYFRTVIDTGEASLRPLFGVLPWILAVFVAASTMRLVAEEQRDGTLEILFTQPIRGWSVLIAKFLAALMFVGAGIVATVAIPITLQSAGDFDNGAIIAQYIGTFFLTASFVAIGLFTSSLSRNQIVAFILALAIIMVLMLGGFPLVTLALPSALARVVQDLSPLTHFSGISRGVLDLRDVLYFGALISTFLSGTYLMVRSKSISHHSPLFRNLQLGVGGLVVISLLIALSGRSIAGRWDLTENKLYTLSPATEQLLAGLDDLVTIKMFTSKDPPVQVSLVSREVNHFLDDIASKSQGKVKILRRIADEDEEAEFEARHSFVPPIQFNIQSQSGLEIKTTYLGLGMTYGNRQEPIQFIDTIDGLEYRVLSNIFRMTQKKKKIVGFLFGHGEKRRDGALQSLRNQLERTFDVDELDYGPGASGDLEASFVDVIVVAGPTEQFNPEIFEQFDNFLAGGGKALILVDPVRVDDEQMTAEANPTNLMSEFLEPYGINVGTDLVFDVRSNEVLSFGTRSGRVSLNYPYWVRVPAVERIISGGIPSAVFPWASSIEIGDPADSDIEVEVTNVLQTSPAAALDTEYSDITPVSPRLESYSEQELAQRLLAVALTGTRCPLYESNCQKDPAKPFRMIVATDSDWMAESMVSQYPGHLSLAGSWIDWLAQEDALTSIRSKGSSIRSLVFDSVTHRNLIQYGNIVGLPAVFVVLGLLRFIVRRNVTRKVYTREE
jgi:ABC-2 type transport system permease protein